ncbi:MAG: HEAT repeat domain-containing protein, partial [Kiritimatiellia bacterium]
DNTAWGAGMGLSYTIPRRTLRISGAPPTEYSRQVSLPGQIWGTEADHDFYSLVPVPSSRGAVPDVQRERVGRGYWIPAILDRISSGDADVIRTYIHHPDIEVRRRAAERLDVAGEEVVLEALRSEDARLRDAGVMALENHASLRTAASMAILLEMIEHPEESWWVVQRALQVIQSHLDDIDTLKAHTDRLLYWAAHDDWWLSQSALRIVMRLAAHAHETERILQTVGRRIAVNRRNPHWSERHLFRDFEGASDEVRDQLLAMLHWAYQAWPSDVGDHQEPVHPGSEPDFLGGMARAMSALDGGLERLYQISQQRYPEKALAHPDVFLNNQDRLAENPALLSRVLDLTRDELIPKFVVERAYNLLVRLDTVPRSGSEQFRFTHAEGHMNQLISLYQRAGIDDYNWHDYGPERTEMEWWYHSFDPVEPPPLGEEDARMGRYREVTYPAGMEHWNQPDFDAAAAGWQRGLAPFAHLDGEQLSPWNRCNRHEGRGLDFCGCAEPPNTFWEKEVLLKAGVFEIPPFEEGYAYRILVGGASHVGFGDGTHIYVNGQQIFQRDSATPRRRGAEPIGARVTTERWEDFASGRVHLAAKSFLKYRGNRFGNYLTVFMRRMKLPPLRDELYRGLQLVGLRNAAWQTLQDPESNIDPDEDLYIWNGEVRSNPEAIGSWKVVDQVQAIRDFDPHSRQQPSGGLRPPFAEIELADDLRTSDPLLVWTGSMLLDAGRKEALAVEHAQVEGKDYLFIEAGGFSQEHPSSWTSSWLVFEKQ